MATKVIEVERTSRYFSPQVEIGTLDGSSPIGFEEGPNDDIHFTLRTLFFENDVSPMSSDSFPKNSGITSHNLPLVLYHNHYQFLPMLVKVIMVHKINSTYKANTSNGRISNHSLGPQGSSQPISQIFMHILLV